MTSGHSRQDFRDLKRARKILQYCELALTKRREERAAFLEECCGDDLAILAEIQSLLAAIDDSGSFMKLE